MAAGAIPFFERVWGRLADRSVAGWLGLGLTLTGGLIWLGVQSQAGFFDEANGRPPPTWTDPKRVQAQMSDGRMVSMKLSFEVDDPDTADAVEKLRPAINSLIQASCQSRSRRSLSSKDGLRRFSDELTDKVNDYLEDRHVKGQVKQVLFDEFLVLPVSDVNAVN